jgi:hypothetical protein
MTNHKLELIPTTIRLSADMLNMLNEASSLQQITRADLIRLSIQRTMDNWKQVDRRRVIEQLEAR